VAVPAILLLGDYAPRPTKPGKLEDGYQMFGRCY